MLALMSSGLEVRIYHLFLAIIFIFHFHHIIGYLCLLNLELCLIIYRIFSVLIMKWNDLMALAF